MDSGEFTRNELEVAKVLATKAMKAMEQGHTMNIMLMASAMITSGIIHMLPEEIQRDSLSAHKVLTTGILSAMNHRSSLGFMVPSSNDIN